MEQIYKGLGMIYPEGSKKEIEIIKKGATCFPILLAKQQEAWGIWMNVSDKLLLVNPVSLVNTLFTDGRQYDFFLSYADDKADRFTFWAERKEYSIEATLGHPLFEGKACRRFMLDEYAEKIRGCCTALAGKVREGQPLAYDEKEIPKDALLTCAAQVELRATLPSYYVVRTADVVIEPFLFDPLNEEYHEQYEIKIGNRGYKTWLTHWDSDMEAIRHELESIVYEEEATVRLPFDMSETLIKIKKKGVLDQVTDVGTGTAYKYKDYMLVEIHPNEFVHMPIIKGYCDKRGMIRSLYEGLLRMAIQHPETYEEPDVPSRMVAYNKYKSPLIESYLKEVDYEEDKYALRQVHVKHILTIDPDYGQLFIDEIGISYVEMELIDFKGETINIDELIAWQKEIEPIVVASETGKDYDKDWQDYHKRGLALAHQLRALLPSSYDLWYSKPFEEKRDYIDKPTLII